MSKRDYYEVRGGDRGAERSESKKAERKLARKDHPDKNPGDAAAEARFKEATQAYDVLSDKQKRAAYDQRLRGGFTTAIGITNQRETVVAWSRSTSEPVHKALVWQDRRTAERCEQLEAEGALELVRSRTGLVLDPYFSGSMTLAPSWAMVARTGASWPG